MGKFKWWLWGPLVVVLAIVATLLGACGDPAQPQVCATWQAPNGQWMEEDNEEVDSDPCDLDDAFEVEHKKTKKPVAPRTSKPKPPGGRDKKF